MKLKYDICCFGFLTLRFFLPCEVFGQSVMTPSPSGFDNIGSGLIPPIYALGNNVYFGYLGNDGHNELGVFSGSTLNLYPFPTGYNGPGIGMLNPENSGNLPGKFITQLTASDGNNDMAWFSGGSFTILQSPLGFEGSGAGMSGPVGNFGNNFYSGYTSNSGNNAVGFFDGAALNIPSLPSGYSNPGSGFTGNSASLGNQLCLLFEGNDGNQDLVVYDGLSYTDFPSPAGYTTAGAGPELLSVKAGNCYLKYKGDDNNFDLGIFDGISVSLISSPAGYQNANAGYTGELFEYLGFMWLVFEGNDGNRDLFRWNGSSLTAFPSPAGYDGPAAGPANYAVTCSGKLCCRMIGNDLNADLGIFDGTAFSMYSSPSGFENPNCGVWNNDPATNLTTVCVDSVLFFRMKGNDGNFDLGYFDGTTLNIQNSFAGYNDPGFGFSGFALGLGDHFYMRYTDNIGTGYIFEWLPGLIVYGNSSGWTGANGGVLDFEVTAGPQIFFRSMNDAGNYTLGRFFYCENPDPVVISATPSEICAEESVTLSIVPGALGTASGWSIYSGTCGGTLEGTGLSITVFPDSTKTYFARADGNCITGGACDTATVTVHFLPEPVITVPSDTICLDGGSVSISVIPSGGTLSGPGLSGLVFDPLFTGVGLVEWIYNYTDGFGCAGDDTANAVVDSCIFHGGISHEFQLKELKVFVRGNQLVCENLILADTYVIYSSLGIRVKVFRASAELEMIDISELPAGVYFLIKNNQTGTGRKWLKM